MSEKIMKKSRVLISALLGTVMIAALTLSGCGTSSYDDPNASITTTKTASALIDATTLKQWMDEGKVNSTDPASRDRVVIVTVAKATQYAAQHIPGALLIDSDSELNMTRLEGVAPISTMVLDGPSIDNLVKKLCINQNTTIVFVASKGQNALNPARAYFTFRYWGFPKERLKILDGGENGWETAATAGSWAASYALNTTVPTVTPSTFSVRNLYAGITTNFNVRTSIGEMISVVDKINATTLTTGPTGTVSILDARGGAPTTYIANSGVDDFNQYVVSGAGNASTYKVPNDLIARLATFDVNAAKAMNYVYCASGVRASSVYFVLDGILGWPTTLYDGSWNQWSAYRAQTAPAVSPGNAWLITANSPTTTLPRTTIGAAVLTGTLTVDTTANILYTNIADPRANQILNEDKAYFTSGGTTTAPSTGGGTGGGSGC